MISLINSKNQDYNYLISNVHDLIKVKQKTNSLSKKLQNWPQLEFKDFLKELKKQKVKLSLSEQSEWMQYFNEQKQKANDLQTQITQTNREIDRMVCDLYGLTDEEIKIVEESVG